MATLIAAFCLLLLSTLELGLTWSPDTVMLVALTQEGDLISVNSSSWTENLYEELARENHFCTPFGCSSSYNDTWSNMTDKYAALRIKIGLDTLYGWVRAERWSERSDRYYKELRLQ